MSKEESVETAPAKPATPPPKPAAAKAAAATASSKTAVPRRSLLSWVTLAWVAFTASMLASLTARASSMFPDVLFEPPPTLKAGLADEIQVGQVDERFKQRVAGGLVRSACAAG